MTIKELNINDIGTRKLIDTFLNNMRNVDVKQTTQWYELRDEQKKYLYIECEKNKIILCCNTFELFDDKSGGKVLYLPRGPVYDDKYITFDECIKYIYKYAKEKKFKFIRLNPNIPKKALNYDELRKLGYDITIISEHSYDDLFESPREAIIKVDNVSKEELLNYFHHKTRYNIRKSTRSNLECKITKNINIEDYYKLYLQTASRHSFTPHPLSYFKKLIEVFNDKVVFCSVFFNNMPLAISINIKQSNTLYYLYGSSSDNNKNLFPSYRLHWEMIKYAIDNHFEFYNFGGVFSDDDDMNNKDYGLMIFKSRFCYNGFTIYNPDLIIKI